MLGFNVEGKLEGRLVCNVGTMLGLSVGENDGLTVGRTEGILVGRRLAFALLGLTVGNAIEGFRVGAIVGNNEGDLVGTFVGKFEGEKLDFMVGNGDG